MSVISKWLRNVLTIGQRDPGNDQNEVAFYPNEPEPTLLPLSEEVGNPILDLLKEWRLPLGETRDEVIARVGISSDPLFQREQILLTDVCSLQGALSPWTAQSFDRIPRQFPITRFNSPVWFEDDAHSNMKLTASHIAQNLGKAVVGRRWNTLVARWQCDLAAIELTSWPPEWQSWGDRNDAYDREPRLRTACLVNVATGFRQRLSEVEKEWVTTYRPIAFEGTAGTAGSGRAGALAPSEFDLEYARDPEGIAQATQLGSLGLAQADEALVVIADQLMVMARQHIVSLDVCRLTPAKGGGGSTLYANCITAAPGADTLAVLIAQAKDPDGMNELAATLGARLGCPVQLSAYMADV